MGGLAERVYRMSPTGLQHLWVTAYGAYWNWTRFGPGFDDRVAGFERRERYSAGDWAEWTRRRLEKLLAACSVHVPFYSETWTAGEKEAAAQGRLEELPLLEKDPLRSQPERFLRTDLRPRRTLVHHTSGSSGTPIAVYWRVPEYRDSIALRESRSARWGGVSYRLPRATFSGRMVEPEPDSPGPYYRFNAVEKQVYFSPFHLRRDTARQYVDALWRHGVRWLTGYAVSYYLLAQHILEDGLKAPPLDAVITTSEKVTPPMRGVMEEAYGCRVYEEYSTVENVLFASECDHGSLHVSPEGGVVEILDPDGRPCEPGVEGEVVATCLLRDYMPFVRFRLGDVARWASEPCPCGRPLPVLEEVVGRLEDVVVGPDGRRMVRFHGLYIGLPEIRCGQVVQEAPDRITVLLETVGELDPATGGDVVRRVHDRLGSGVEVRVEAVREIPRDASGKIRAVVSRLNAGGTGGHA